MRRAAASSGLGPKAAQGVLLGALALVAAVGDAASANLARGRTDLPELVLGSEDGNDYAVSEKEIAMEGGKYYRLSITAKGSKEYKFLATEFFRNIWLTEIVINNLEIHMMGAPHHLEFDDQGTIELLFVPIRAGEYQCSVQGLEDTGMLRKFVVT